MRKRRSSSIKEIRDVQNEVNWDPNKLTCKNTLPHLIFPVFIEVLEAQQTEFHIAVGEADKEIAALANHHKCPVLASDSDYFLFNLKHGFIHFGRYCEKPEVKPLYKVSDFQKQYSLKQYELLLVIPSIFGNERHKQRNPEDYEKVVTQLAKYDTLEEYFKSSEVAITEETYRTQQQYYSNLITSGNLNTKYPDLPEWVLVAIKQRKFPS